MNLKDKTVVVTGAGSGIGKATALYFGKYGAKVVVSDINPDSAKEVADAILMADGKAMAAKTDVTDLEQVTELLQKAVASFGQLDVMVNNAGIGGKQQAKTAEHTLEDWHNVVAVNQTGVFYCMKSALSIMQ